MEGGTEGNINCGKLGRQFREDAGYKKWARLQQYEEWQKLAEQWRACRGQGSEGWGEAMVRVCGSKVVAI